MEVSLVGKPTTANVAKACVICGTETDYLVAHNPTVKSTIATVIFMFVARLLAKFAV